jgi:hypothetical protein
MGYALNTLSNHQLALEQLKELDNLETKDSRIVRKQVKEIICN